MSWGWPHCWKPVANSVKLKAATCIDLDDGTAEVGTIVGSREPKHVELEVGELESASPLCRCHPNKTTCHRWAIHELGQTCGTGEVSVGGWICAPNVTTCLGMMC